MILMRTRATELAELMDDPDCDLGLLESTYAQFGPLNRLLSGWKRLWATRIRPYVVRGETFRVLDLGSGGGDLARNLAAWAARGGFDVQVTAADPDPRASAFARRHPWPRVTYVSTTSAALADEGAQYDIVVSNHVMHHLDGDSFGRILADCEALAPRALHSDLRRSPVSYALYGLGTLPWARSSFIRTDGMRSIRRSFTPPELRLAAPPGWRVEADPPFRLLLTRGLNRSEHG
ncbi:MULTISPECIES: methyltransferase domain-containing protein [unclassified Salinibacterium]|uniref:methyltransferase domain-containing protein n=1 Tax=unclassified Salinibacterium TaxID=2632331 RepID=UPI001420B55F|nr:MULTISPECIES: methyltransferase domain-containing protein [unclassified Salinibacterium]